MLRPGLRVVSVEGRARLTDDGCDVGLDHVAAALVDAVDGVRDEPAVLAAAGGDTTAPALQDRWGWLWSRGLLVDAEAHLSRLAQLREDGAAADAAPPDDPLADLLAHPGPDQRWSARRAAQVRVVGNGRTTNRLVRLLRASGVAVGTTRDAGVSPAAPKRSGAPDPADLTVLTHDHEPPTDLLEDLLRRDASHLVGGIRDASGHVGPFVVPGWTACTRCLDLRRTAGDPSWRWRRAALSRPTSHPLATTTASPVVVAAAAALLAAEVVAFAEGRTPQSAGAVFRIPPTHPVPVREVLEPHPWCGCIGTL